MKLILQNPVKKDLLMDLFIIMSPFLRKYTRRSVAFWKFLSDNFGSYSFKLCSAAIFSPE